MYIRSKKIKNKQGKTYTYYYIVDNVRDENGVRKQKVLTYLGTAENVLNKINKIK